MARAAHRLATDPLLIARLVSKRPEWTAEAIENTALEGDLGYEADCRFAEFSGPATLFAYSCGIKARWKNKVIRWICGGASGELWRQSLLLRSGRIIYVSEGESDALTLLSSGVEQQGESLVAALASAQIMPKAEPFKGRDIVIVPDPDSAGVQAERKLRSRLQPLTRSIVTVSIQEVLNG